MSGRTRFYLATVSLAGAVSTVLSRLPDSVARPALFASVIAFGWLLIGLPNSGAKRLESREGQLVFGLLSGAGAFWLVLASLLNGEEWLFISEVGSSRSGHHSGPATGACVTELGGWRHVRPRSQPYWASRLHRTSAITSAIAKTAVIHQLPETQTCERIDDMSRRAVPQT